MPSLVEAHEPRYCRVACRWGHMVAPSVQCMMGLRLMQCMLLVSSHLPAKLTECYTLTILHHAGFTL
jgi:hypothetical protein